MPFPFKSRRISGIRHFGVISRILVKHGLGEVADRLWGRGKAKSGLPDPVRIRRALEDLGPSFIKLGQLMSTRADIFPPEYIEEFSKLQDQVPPVAFEPIKQLVESELRQRIDELFGHFDSEPMAAASPKRVVQTMELSL